MTDDCRYLELIRSAIDATTFHSPVAYSWFGSHSVRLPARVARVMKDRTARNYLQTQLRNQLYSDLYLCGEARRPMWTDEVYTDRDAGFVETLSLANKGTGCLEHGWQIVEKREAEVAVQRDRLTLWVGWQDLVIESTERFAAGDSVTVRLPKELRNISPGYYYALSNGDDGVNQSGTLIRLYWNLKAEGAPLLLQLVTERFNESGCYFHLKVLNNRSSYTRCDAGVLYCKQVDYQIVHDLLVTIYQRVEGFLKANTPAFTKALAPGLGLAEDPVGFESFGQHRCKLLASGMIRAQEEGAVHTEDRIRIVSKQFSEAGIQIKLPFLNAGSMDRYRFALGTC